ncbi:MAG: cation:proton antiporter, partial [Gordonibacter sp.]
MPVDFVSLAAIALVAAVCPLIAQAIPGKPIPETVFLLLAGALLGPHLLSVVHLTESVGLLSDLGLAFLFLLAGYDISPKNLTSNQGKRGLVTWVV